MKVCAFEIPVLILSGPDVVFIEHVVLAVSGHGIKHLREPARTRNTTRDVVTTLKKDHSTFTGVDLEIKS